MNLSELRAAIRRRLTLLVGRGTIVAVDDSGTDTAGSTSPQRITVRTALGELIEDVPLLQPYSLAVHPHPGAQVMLVEEGAARSRLAAVVVDDPRYRPTGQVEGEVRLYTDEHVAIALKRGKVIEISGDDLDIQVNGSATIAPTAGLTIDGDLVITGTLTAQGIAAITGPSTIDGKVFLSHTHSGVSSGANNSGPVA